MQNYTSADPFEFITAYLESKGDVYFKKEDTFCLRINVNPSVRGIVVVPRSCTALETCAGDPLAIDSQCFQPPINKRAKLLCSLPIAMAHNSVEECLHQYETAHPSIQRALLQYIRLDSAPKGNVTWTHRTGAILRNGANQCIVVSSNASHKWRANQTYGKFLASIVLATIPRPLNSIFSLRRVEKATIPTASYVDENGNLAARLSFDSLTTIDLKSSPWTRDKMFVEDDFDKSLIRKQFVELFISDLHSYLEGDKSPKDSGGQQ